MYSTVYEKRLFPSKSYRDAAAFAAEYFDEYSKATARINTESLVKAGRLLQEAVARDAAIFSSGNGGSAAISNHLACDCLKGVRTGTSVKPRVISLSATTELITAIGNDLGYDQIFTYQLQSLAKPGDLLIAISSSCTSPNIISALRWAKAHGMATLALTGFSGGAAAEIADVSLHVPAENYGVVEDAHQSLMHLLAQFLRQATFLCPDQLGKVKF